MRTTLRQSLAAVSCAALAATVAAGCGADSTIIDKESVSPSTESSSAATSPLAFAQELRDDEVTTAAPTTDNAPAEDTSPKSQEDTGSEAAKLVVSDIRVGEHEGKDRVVFEFSGTGEPGYSVDYVDAPTQQASGRPVGATGDSFLEVLMTGQVYPTMVEATEVPVGTLDTEEVSGIADVAFAGQFEGRAQAVIGVEGTDRGFTVFTLANPTRLVVDIAR